MPTTANPPISSVADTDAIRAAFPALRRRHDDTTVAYFDGPGGTQVPQPVVDAATGYMLGHNANSGWRYATSVETDTMVDAARAVLADFVGGEAEEISFGPNMTTLTFHVARALGRRWGAGDEIAITELDHHANVAPWRALELERGVAIRVVRMDPETGTLDMDDLERALGPRTRLLAIGAASNALGTINDVALAAKLAHDAGALCFVDAVHYAPHRLVDVRAIDCDLLACSAYKFYGPHVGVLWTRRGLGDALDSPRLEPAPQTMPGRLETGTLNFEGVAGAAAAVTFLAGIAGGGGGGGTAAPDAGATRRSRLEAAFAGLHERGEALFARLWEGLAAIDGVTLFGPRPGEARTPTLIFDVAGSDPGDVAEELSARGVFVSHGDFYAPTLIERIGRAERGLVRAGCACYTTDEEIDRLVDGVRALL